MSSENEALVLRLFEAINEADDDALRGVLADDCPAYENGRLGSKDPQGYVEFTQGWRNAFPDLHVSVEDLVAGGDRSAARVTVRGTHKGDLDGVAPTGKKIEIQAIVMHRFDAGKITEEQVVVDTMTLMQQVGAIPA